MAFRLASAFVDVNVRDAALNRGFRSTRSKFTQFAASISRIGATVGIGAAVGGFAALTRVLSTSIPLAERQIQAEARLEAALRATGGAAGFTADELKTFASELQSATTTGDEEILELMAQLTTFKSVSGDVFKRATEAALDLAATGFGTPAQAAIQLAKALEDPIRGLGALRRVGVSFSSDQENRIKRLTEENRLYEAQDILLKAVEGQVEGVSKAIADTPVGRAEQLSNEFGDLKERLGTQVIPAVTLFKETLLIGFKALETGLQSAQNELDGFKFDDLTSNFRFAISVMTKDYDAGLELMKKETELFVQTLKDQLHIPLQLLAALASPQQAGALIGSGLPGTREPSAEAVELARQAQELRRNLERRFFPRRPPGAGLGPPTDEDDETPQLPPPEGLFFGPRQPGPTEVAGMMFDSARAERMFFDQLFNEFDELAGIERDRKQTMRDERGGFTALDQLNRRMQERFLEEDDPQKETNKILDEQKKKQDEAKGVLDSIDRNLQRQTPVTIRQAIA